MHSFQISDLSFCEAIEKDIKVQGGVSTTDSLTTTVTSSVTSNSLRAILNILLPSVSSSALLSEEYSGKEVYSDPKVVVSTLENKNTGESGYIISSKDGKSHTGLVVGSKSKRAFGLSVASVSF